MVAKRETITAMTTAPKMSIPEGTPVSASKPSRISVSGLEHLTAIATGPSQMCGVAECWHSNEISAFGTSMR
jgi:hypothetical protein